MENKPVNLPEFLLARIAEDEDAARAACYEGQRWLTGEEDVLRWPADELVHVASRKRHAAHIARHDPARVLADCAFKRGLVEDAQRAMTVDFRRITDQDVRERAECEASTWEHDVLRPMAQLWAEDPDFNPSWR